MKKIKSIVFVFILSAIIFGGIGVVSAYTIFASNIQFIPQDSKWNVDNVESALNYLYINANNSTNSEILWINNEISEENKEFKPQTIPLDLTNYKSVIILGYYAYVYPNIKSYVEIEVGKTGNLTTIWNYSSSDQTSREINVTTSGVEFKEGIYLYTNKTDNVRSIPMYIIGIK